MSATRDASRPDHVFVVTYGRSGSTLLQGLLNTLPGTLVRGENDFFLHALFRGHRALARTQERWARPAELKGAASAFYGADVLDLPAAEDDLRQLVDRQLLGSEDPSAIGWLGFKEVLWHQVTPEETAHFLDFMDALFPEARYVLHRRDHEAVLASGFWKKWDQDKARDAVIRVEAFQDTLVVGREDRVCWTTYEDLTSQDTAVSDPVLAQVAQLLGHEATPALMEQLRATRAIGHGPNPTKGEKPVPVGPERVGPKKRAQQAASQPAPNARVAAPTGDDRPPSLRRKFGSRLKSSRVVQGTPAGALVAAQPARRPVAHRRPPAHAGLPRVAVMTMVHNEAGMLPRWISYYGGQVGHDHLIVLDDNSTDGSTDDPGCSVVRMPPHPWKQSWGIARVGLANRLAEGLLSAYDVVVFTDVDEFLVPEPSKYKGLVDYLAAKPDPDVVAPLAFNVLHRPSVEGELEDDRPVLQQRTHVKYVPGLCKPLVKRASVDWSTAFHGVTVPFAIDPDLLMLHLKYFDMPSLGAVAAHRHRVHEEDDRGNKLSAWAFDADELTSRAITWSEVPAGASVPELDPAAIDFSDVVRLSKKGIHRAFGPQMDAMDEHPLLQLPERFRSAF